jgi:CDP-glucose 4,6-dehydratase
VGQGKVVFAAAYRNKRVLVTGHTGFKGSWFSQWLLDLGAIVCGISLAPATQPSLYSLLGLEAQLESHLLDIRDTNKVRETVDRFGPEIIFHLAAQPLVRESYRDPVTTWTTNVVGTVNVLEAVRECETPACVVITTDKVYRNKEHFWGYREFDELGGVDPYSASKAAAELVVSSYQQAFFGNSGSCVASARAGNVIGGGDWAADRIMTDIVQAAKSGSPLELRYPNSTRPWLHVLEPLAGYLLLGLKLLGDEGRAHSTSWNFGPLSNMERSVKELAEGMSSRWNCIDLVFTKSEWHEAGYLRLDSTRSQKVLGWMPVWDFHTTLDRICEWHESFDRQNSAVEVTRSQIREYTRIVAERS